MKGAIQFLLENSLFLILGAVAALVWANIDIESYHHLVHLELFSNPWIGQLVDGQRVVTLHYFVNDILMALFFAIAGKEVWEATFPGGPLSNPRKAATPLVATIGGMAGPVLFFLGIAAALGAFDELARGWAVPTATDIAFSYMVARVVFGTGHPAIPFLLLLAIADDALGLLILAVFYPQGDVQPVWLLLAVAAVVLGLGFRRMRVASFWPYLVFAGTLSWFGFALAGLHPALGLLPIVPTMPHAHTDVGLFDWRELQRDDTLNQFEHWWSRPVELILGVFGLLNAGVVLSAAGDATWAVLGALVIGKPVGIFLFTMFAARVLGFGLPEGMRPRDVVALGCAAGIGFTVALFVSTVAFPVPAGGGAAAVAAQGLQDAAKMGALGSFLSALVTIVVGRAVGVQKVPARAEASSVPGTASH